MKARLAGAAALLMSVGAAFATQAAPGPSNVTVSGAGWMYKSADRLQVWSNSPEASLTLENRQHSGFTNFSVTWDNLMAGTFLATPEGVVIGSTRDGGPLASQLAVSPGERQSWSLRPNVNGAYHFAVVADTRNPVTGQQVYGRLSRAMASHQVSFALHLGDAVNHGNGGQLELFREQLRSFPFPTYVVPGNEDLGASGRPDWERLFGTVPLSFRVSRDRFVLLDNADGGLAPRQEAWLRGALQQASGEGARHIFVFLHRPLVDVRPGMNDAMHDLVQVRRLLRLFQQHRVRAVFAGHIAMYARETRRGVTYVTTGGGGERLAPRAGDGAFHHYVDVAVDGDGVAIRPIKL